MTVVRNLILFWFSSLTMDRFNLVNLLIWGNQIWKRKVNRETNKNRLDFVCFSGKHNKVKSKHYLNYHLLWSFLFLIIIIHRNHILAIDPVESFLVILSWPNMTNDNIIWPNVVTIVISYYSRPWNKLSRLHTSSTQEIIWTIKAIYHAMDYEDMES